MFVSYPPGFTYTTTLRALLEHVQCGTLRKSTMTRELVWPRSMVVRLWSDLYAGHSLGRIITRRVVRDAKGYAVAHRAGIPKSGLPACDFPDGMPDLIDGTQRCAALAMSAFGMYAHTSQSVPVSYRVAFDPLDETFLRGATRRVNTNPLIMPDISTLFVDSSNTQNVIDAFIERAIRASPIGIEQCDRMQKNLQFLSTLLDVRQVVVCEMGLETTPEQALQALQDANGWG